MGQGLPFGNVRQFSWRDLTLDAEQSSVLRGFRVKFVAKVAEICITSRATHVVAMFSGFMSSLLLFFSNDTNNYKISTV